MMHTLVMSQTASTTGSHAGSAGSQLEHGSPHCASKQGLQPAQETGKTSHEPSSVHIPSPPSVMHTLPHALPLQSVAPPEPLELDEAPPVAKLPPLPELPPDAAPAPLAPAPDTVAPLPLVASDSSSLQPPSAAISARAEPIDATRMGRG